MVPIPASLRTWALLTMVALLRKIWDGDPIPAGIVPLDGGHVVGDRELEDVAVAASAGATRTAPPGIPSWTSSSIPLGLHLHPRLAASSVGFREKAPRSFSMDFSFLLMVRAGTDTSTGYQAGRTLPIMLLKCQGAYRCASNDLRYPAHPGHLPLIGEDAMTYVAPSDLADRPIAVVGGGTLGRRIALMLATRGAEVRIYDVDRPAPGCSHLCRR